MRWYETMTKYVISQGGVQVYQIRVWRMDLEGAVGPDHEIGPAIDGVSLSHDPTEDIPAILAAIEKLERIEAIEVLDKNGHGAILYPDWR